MTHHLSIFSHARLSVVALFAASVLALSPVAFAHGGAKAAHGGIAQVAHDINFELVAQADGATLYLVDHGKPMSSQGIGGKLTILNKGQKSEADLKPAGDNKLLAAGVTLSPGAKVVAVLNGVHGKTVTVRFTVK
jgi:hypothetical protein